MTWRYNGGIQGSRDGDGCPGAEADAGRNIFFESVRLKDGSGLRTGKISKKRTEGEAVRINTLIPNFKLVSNDSEGVTFKNKKTFFDYFDGFYYS